MLFRSTKSSKSIGNDTDVKLEVTNDTNVKLEVTLDTLNNIISSCFKTQMCGGFILEEGLDRHQAMKTLQGSVDRVKEQKGVRFSEESITDVEAYATKNGGKGVCIGGSFMVSSFNDNVIIEEEVNEAKTETKTTTKDIYNLKPKVNEKDAKGNEITSLPATTKTFKLGNNINVMKYHASSGTGEAGKDKLNRMLFLDTTGEFLEEGKNNVIMADANFDVLSTNNLEELISFAKEKNVKFAIPPHKIIKQRYLANPLLNNQMGKFEQKEAESKIIAFTGETCHFESNAAIVIDGKKTKEEVVTEIQSSKKAFSKDVPLDHFIFKGHLNVDGQDVYFEDSNDMSITDKRKGIKEKNPFSGKRDLVECLGRYIAIKLLDYERGVESQ